MPYNAAGGAYVNVAGATTAVAGQIIQSAVWDNIHTDLGNALTQVMQQLISSISDRNALYMNGGMEVWQRGAGNAASIAVAASTLQYTADRWYIQTGANQASTVAAAVGLASGSALCAQVQRNVTQTGVTGYVFAYPLDSDEVLRLRGNKVSFSCLAKAGTNWSPASGTLTVTLFLGTGASPAKRNATPYAGETSAFAIATNLTAGVLTTITGNSSAVVPAATTQAELQFSWIPVGTAGANDFVQLDDVQVEAQLSAATWTPTNFDRLPFPRQLADCQRHWCKTFPYNVHATVSAGNAGAISVLVVTTNASFGAQFLYPVRMRATASVVAFNPVTNTTNWRNITVAADITSAIDPGSQLSDNMVFITGVSASSGNEAVIHITASAGI